MTRPLPKPGATLTPAGGPGDTCMQAASLCIDRSRGAPPGPASRCFLPPVADAPGVSGWNPSRAESKMK